MSELIKMDIKDIEVCTEIYVKAFEKTKEYQSICDFDHYFRSFINGSDKYAYVLKSDNEIVGLLTAFQIPSFVDDFSVHIDSVAISPEYQRQGNGRTMLKSFIDLISDGSGITINAYKDKPSYKLYVDVGFYDIDNISHLMYSPELAKLVREYEMLTKENEELKSEINKHD